MNKNCALRDRVLYVVESSKVPLTGRDIAAKAGLQYKQTIDALDALNNYGKVKRIGKKFNARWFSLTDDPAKRAFAFFNNAFLSMSKKRLGDGKDD